MRTTTFSSLGVSLKLFGCDMLALRTLYNAFYRVKSNLA